MIHEEPHVYCFVRKDTAVNFMGMFAMAFMATFAPKATLAGSSIDAFEVIYLYKCYMCGAEIYLR